MNKRELLLVALSAGGQHSHTPVQVQKLLFLIDKNVGSKIGGPIFNFEPYDYGPFDVSVYDTLRELETDGAVSSTLSRRGWKYHALTDKGIAEAAQLKQSVSQDVIVYISTASNFVRNLSFTDLVSAIYKAYPEMKAKSVFKE